MSYIDLVVRVPRTDHRLLMDRAAVKGRTVTELAGEILRAGIHSRAWKAREAAWDEYRTRRRIGAADADRMRAAFVAGWESAHGRPATGFGRPPRARLAEGEGPNTARRRLPSTRTAAVPVTRASHAAATHSPVETTDCMHPAKA